MDLPFGTTEKELPELWKALWGHGLMNRAILNGLKAQLGDHGPITQEWLGSAVKRIRGQMKCTVNVYCCERRIRLMESQPPEEIIHPRDGERCSFCRKGQSIVESLIVTPGDCPKAYICDECVEVCVSILEEQRKFRHTADTRDKP